MPEENSWGQRTKVSIAWDGAVVVGTRVTLFSKVVRLYERNPRVRCLWVRSSDSKVFVVTNVAKWTNTVTLENGDNASVTDGQLYVEYRQ